MVQVVVPAAHAVEPLPAASAAGSEETQVSGGLGTMQPCTSTAVAVIVSVVPLLTTKLVWLLCCEPFTPSSSAMHCTGQVSKLDEGWLETPEAEAMTWVCPGSAGRYVHLVGGHVVGLSVMIGVSMATLAFAWLQEKGPTEAVISVPWLSNAVACKVRTWFCERQELVALNGRLQAAGSAVWAGQAGGGELTGGTRLT